MAYIDKNKLLKIVGFELGMLFSQEAPKQSTRLSRAFMSTMKVENGVITYTLPYYAKYVIEGSPAHEIKVKNAKSLAVPVKDWNGKTPNPYGSKKGFPMYSKDKKFVLLGKKVNIPARPPNFFIQDVLNQNIKQVIEKAIKMSIVN
jgi:hypothetical protein